MRHLIAIKILVILLASFSCRPNSKSTNLWPDSTMHDIVEGAYTLSIPNQFEKSSIYTIEHDVPIFIKDSITYEMFHKILKNYEFVDGSIDVYVNKSSDFNFFFILDVDVMPITKINGNIVNTQLNNMYQEIENEYRELSIVELESHIRNNANQAQVKFKYSWTNIYTDFQFYITSFIVTIPSRTFVIHEYSLEFTDIERNLWSIK